MLGREKTIFNWLRLLYRKIVYKVLKKFADIFFYELVETYFLYMNLLLVNNFLSVDINR